MDEKLYAGREQSWVKHQILQRYLLQFAMIVGQRWNSITYIDGFSGPWQSKSESYEDTSFAIAIRRLREARDKLREDTGKALDLRAFFIEKDKASFQKLEEYRSQISDVEIEIRNNDFESVILDIREFIQKPERPTFPFVFIDPKGWTGFALDVIEPLLQLPKCEFLVNFMTSHIIRFINNEESRESFKRLFGSEEFREILKNTQKEDRVDASVFEYCKAVSRAGEFDYFGVAGILEPNRNRNHFHLIYLTRHIRGLQVFKSAEKKSMQEMENLRAALEKSNRKNTTGQRGLFDDLDTPNSNYYEKLKTRYLEQAEKAIYTMLSAEEYVKYEDIWKTWNQYPLVWDKNLKNWIKQNPEVEIVGLSQNEKVPKLDQEHYLRLNHNK